MNTLNALAEEYLRNVAVMEQRIEELETKRRILKNHETRRKLGDRICTLRRMVNESRQIAFRLEHYYDKPGEGDVYVKPKPQRDRTKYSGTGYGVASPAACADGRAADAKTVSGLCSAFCGRSSAKCDRG